MPSSSELLNSGPPVDDDAEQSPFLGVPKGYAASRPNPNAGKPAAPGRARVIGATVPVPRYEPAMQTVAPLYRKGDEFRPSALSAEDRARLQLALREAGVFEKSERFQLGVWDATTRGAYKRLLEYANGAGLDWQQALREFTAARQQMGDTAGGGSERAPLAVRLTNPADLRKVIDVGARTITGHRLAPAELDRIVAAYQAEERRAQTDAYNAGDAGGTVVDAPDLETFVEERAKAVNPQGAFRQQAIDVFGELGQILGGGGVSGE